MAFTIMDIILKSIQLITNDTSVAEGKEVLELGLALAINKPKIHEKISP